MEKRSKMYEYSPLIAIIFTFASLLVTATWAISNLHTVNVVQDERLDRLEKNDLKYETRFDRLDNKIDSGFARTYQLMADIQNREK